MRRWQALSTALIIGATIAVGPAGAEPAPPRAAVGAPVFAQGPAVDEHPPMGDAPPSGADAPDAVSGNQTHTIYFLPTDKPYQALEADGTIERAVDGVLAWFARETSAEGGAPVRPRMDRRASGAIDITFVQGHEASEAYPSLDEVYEELITRGFNLAHKRYLVFAALAGDLPGNPGGLCGEGYYPLPGFDVRRYAMVYLDANPGCGARDVGNGTARGAGQAETIVAHEWLHLEAVAPLISRHHCPTSPYHLCFGALWAVPPNAEQGIGWLDPEAPEIMFPLIWSRLGTMLLDRNRDDYLDHGLPAMKDLRTSTWLEPVP